ncbi:hypothetical protein BDN70DRAFT_881682 [Pholiota conissans]|uniref:Uncharacterized protein n=1 Tax=Pholiota conissans TaxID=109636 RepID=A0A9P6CS94_9AGAR|nr:hypothetical protein BDN70DRAFT_881682 [Pholiota conissans]
MDKDYTAIPSPEILKNAAESELLDAKGDKVKFGELIKDKKTVVVFIRHFFCGNCQAFVEQLGSVSSDSLAEADTQIVVIGCGEWNPISTYTEMTKFEGPIYADPTRTLYHTLGMDVETLKGTPKGETKRSYLTVGGFTNAMLSIWRGPMKNPALVGKQGNISQLGGDFIFGPGNTCSLAYRMRHTEDHMEVADLMQAAGVLYP